MPVPSLALGTCIGQAPPNRILAILDGPWAGGVPGEITVGTHGARDGVRGTHGPLPSPGTRGLIAVPRGDIRNGIWVCSIEGSQVDANPGQPGQGGNFRYTAEWSGTWHYRSETGEEVLAWPDGGFAVVGYAAPPTLTRWTLDGNQKRQAVAFTQEQRRPTPAAPMPITLRSGGGATAVMAADGSVVLTSVGGAVLVLAADGSGEMTAASGASILLATDGSVGVHAAAGRVITVSAAGGPVPQAVRLASGAASTVLFSQ